MHFEEERLLEFRLSLGAVGSEDDGHVDHVGGVGSDHFVLDTLDQVLAAQTQRCLVQLRKQNQTLSFGSRVQVS